MNGVIASKLISIGESSINGVSSGNIINKADVIGKVNTEFLTSKAESTFVKLRQTFIIALIMHYFDSDCYISIETNILGYIIGVVFN